MANPKIKTGIPDGEKRRQLFLELVKNNPTLLTIDRIADNAGVTARAVESYLYDGRCPSMFTLYAVFRSVEYAKGTFSREIRNVFNIFEQRWFKCKKFAKTDTPYVYGEMTNIQNREYRYHGEIMKTAEIAKVCGLSYQGLQARIRKNGIENGADITELADQKLTRGRKKR